MTQNGKVTIIAEAAQGFEGDPTLARMLVRAASEGRADMVKFQLVYADELATADYPYHGLFKQLEMPDAAWQKVTEETRRLSLSLVFDVFGLRSLRLARELGAAVVKIHTTDFFNNELFDAAFENFPQVFFSAGGIHAEEIEEFLQRIGPERTKKLTLLFGFQAEPTQNADNNLARLAPLKGKFPLLNLGFLDHSDGDSDEAGWLGVLALPFGITAIEKHITLDRSLKLEDYISALPPREFARYVERIRNAETALGSASLTLSETERNYRRKAVKILVSTRPIAPQRVLTAEDIAFLRSSLKEGKQTLERASEAVGHRTVREIGKGQPIFREDLENFK